MLNHCLGCCGRVVTTDGVAFVTGERDCPGCQECEKLRAELLAVRQSLLRERAGQVKCNSGHVSERALWDCPVCVEAMRSRLAKAERFCNAVARCEQGRGRFSCTPLHDCRCPKSLPNTRDLECNCGGDEYQEALETWEREDAHMPKGK